MWRIFKTRYIILEANSWKPRNVIEKGVKCENVRIWLDNWIPNQLDFTKPHPQG